VVDATTGVVLPTTTIDGRTYVAAEHGQEIIVRLGCVDLPQHLQQWPEGNLNGSVTIEGKSLGYSKTFDKRNPRYALFCFCPFEV